MIQLDVELPDRPGELAKLASVLEEAEVSVDAMALESGGGTSFASLIFDKPVQARKALEDAGFHVTERTVLVVRLEDRPGAFAELARRLGAAGVDIKTVVGLETVGRHVQLAIGVDNIDAARSLV